MRKNLLIMAAALILLTVFAGAVWAEEEMCVPMGDITLTTLSAKAERAAVDFPHAVHFSYSCRECHHKWVSENPIKGCTTSGCHDLAEAPKTDDGKPSKDTLQQIKYYKNAYHTMCIGCHKQIKKTNKELEATQISSEIKLAPTGPTGCIQCHPRD